MPQLRKPVSRAQFRFFTAMLDRIEAGLPSAMKGVTAEQLRAALAGVDYGALPEKAGQAVPTPEPELLPDGVISLEAYRARHPEKTRVVNQGGGPARVLSFDGYLMRNPEKKRRGVSSATGAELFPELFRCAG